ncbi:MAG: PrsW family intramembrane metalloprotease [Haloarculaceae archaeon]
MARRRDPIEMHETAEQDLYDVTDWEVRSRLDRLAVGVYGLLGTTARGILIVVAALILVIQLVLGGLGVISDPVLGLFTLLSVVPALALAAYVWYVDVTPAEPLGLLVATFVLGVLFAGFAGIVNTVAQDVTLRALGVQSLPFLAMVPFYYLVVGPIEETVKLLAVRLYAYRDDRFGAVVDGAVYGAMAGLGFATIENALYIAQSVMNDPGMSNLVLRGGATATVRALAGPGHVIYSAFSGYYLGLARFNRDSVGPIVVKGLLIAALIHATYNSLVSFVPGLIAAVAGTSSLVGFLAFVLVYDGLFGALLFRKLTRYRRVYRQVHGDLDVDYDPELTEFDP